MRYGRRTGAWMLVVGTVLAACGGGAGPSQRGAAESSTSSSATASTVPVTPDRKASPAGTWRAIPPAPVQAAYHPAPVWTGRQLVIWGGTTGPASASNQGASYDPATGQWQPLPPAPIRGRRWHTGVWTGSEVLYWGGETVSNLEEGGFATEAQAGGAAYKPATGTWRLIPAAPIGARSYHEAVWTGREMIVWGGVRRGHGIDSTFHDAAAAAYDPTANAWRRLANAPEPWSGDDGFAASLAHEGQMLVWRRGHLGAYDPTADRWSEIAAPGPGLKVAGPMTTGGPFSMATVTATEVFVWTGPDEGPMKGARVRTSDPTPAWRKVADVPARSYSVPAAGDGRLYLAPRGTAEVLEYNIDEDRWYRLPPPPTSSRSRGFLTWTGTDLLYWGGENTDSAFAMDGALYRP